MAEHHEFPATVLGAVIGRRIVSVTQHPDADEGVVLTLDDGSAVAIGFSGCEGTIEMHEGKSGTERDYQVRVIYTVERTIVVRAGLPGEAIERARVRCEGDRGIMLEGAVSEPSFYIVPEPVAPVKG